MTRPPAWPSWLCVALFAGVALTVAPAWADGGGATTPESTARALPPLPQVPKIALPTPTDEQLADLDARLGRFVSKELNVRQTAEREVLETPRALVPAIERRLNSIADAADRDAMKRRLTSTRDKARTAERARMKAEGKRGAVVTPDYLAMLIEFAEPDDKAWKDLVCVLAMSRMLTQIGSVEAVRKLLDVHVRFGEMLRVDTQLQLEKLGDKAVAALVEARRHRAESIARWATRQLDSLGRGIVSEAVQTEDQEVLADVLRAYGRIRDPDAARIIISFANSERAQIREAARQGVAMLGEVGAWQLRDSYETTVGKKPQRDWTWERTARELFGQLDRLRLAQVYQLFDEGLAHQQKGDLENARHAFDKVLARSPLFERKHEMAKGYLAYAESVADKQPELALDSLRRAHRISESPEEKKRIEGLRLTLEATQLFESGLADRVMVERALELDPGSTRAKELAERMERGEIVRESRMNRFAAAGAIGFVALLAIAFVSLWRGRRPDPQPEPQPEPDSNPVPELEPAPDPNPDSNPVPDSNPKPKPD